MSKSLISAKVLGGGIAGASGIVGTGYGITRYLKSEETTATSNSSQELEVAQLQQNDQGDLANAEHTPKSSGDVESQRVEEAGAEDTGATEDRTDVGEQDTKDSRAEATEDTKTNLPTEESGGQTDNKGSNEASQPVSARTNEETQDSPLSNDPKIADEVSGSPAGSENPGAVGASEPTVS